MSTLHLASLTLAGLLLAPAALSADHRTAATVGQPVAVSDRVPAGCTGEGAATDAPLVLEVVGGTWLADLAADTLGLPHWQAWIVEAAETLERVVRTVADWIGVTPAVWNPGHRRT